MDGGEMQRQCSLMGQESKLGKELTVISGFSNFW